MGLQGCAQTYIKDIDRGQKKRINIGTELLGKPSIIFLEFPFTKMDISQIKSLLNMLKCLNNKGLTVVLSFKQYRKEFNLYFD